MIRVTAVLCLALLAACGIKGDPVPPGETGSAATESP